MLNKFIIKDCFNKRIASFSIPQNAVEDFVNETDVPFFANQSVQLHQRFFWYLMMKYKTEKQWRSMMAKIDGAGHGGDAFFYLQYK